MTKQLLLLLLQGIQRSASEHDHSPCITRYDKDVPIPYGDIDLLIDPNYGVVTFIIGVVECIYQQSPWFAASSMDIRSLLLRYHSGSLHNKART